MKMPFTTVAETNETKNKQDRLKLSSGTYGKIKSFVSLTSQQHLRGIVDLSLKPEHVRQRQNPSRHPDFADSPQSPTSDRQSPDQRWHAGVTHEKHAHDRKCDREIKRPECRNQQRTHNRKNDFLSIRPRIGPEAN